MITTRLYLDCRNIQPDRPAPLKFVITKNKVRALISLNIKISPKDWDAGKQKASGESACHNPLLVQKKSFLDTLIFRMESAGELEGLNASEIKQKVEASLFGVENSEVPSSDSLPNNFKDRYKVFQDTRPAEGTKDLYRRTWIQIEKFAKENKYNLSSLTFEDITVKWLRDFDSFLSKTSPAKNARNIHFRNIRAVFNDALDDEVISCYPFRKFKLKNEETAKRCLTLDELRKVFDCKVEGYAEFYQDMFKLTFFLIGINPVDLAHLDKITNEGRIEYRRAKTHRLYSIKVEPEAMEIIQRWKGKKYLLSILDRWRDYKNFSRQMNIALQCMGAKREGLGGKKKEGLFPDLTIYWARHTWATIASDIDVPDAVISQALGHAAENKTTEIYIRRNRKKVDEANRRVIDYVLGIEKMT